MIDAVLLVGLVLVDPLAAEVGVVVAGENEVYVVLDKEVLELLLHAHGNIVVALILLVVVHGTVELHDQPRGGGPAMSEARERDVGHGTSCRFARCTTSPVDPGEGVLEEGVLGAPGSAVVLGREHNGVNVGVSKVVPVDGVGIIATLRHGETVEHGNAALCGHDRRGGCRKSSQLGVVCC